MHFDTNGIHLKVMKNTQHLSYKLMLGDDPLQTLK
jgi:hypothetical protein